MQSLGHSSKPGSNMELTKLTKSPASYTYNLAGKAYDHGIPDRVCSQKIRVLRAWGPPLDKADSFNNLTIPSPVPTKEELDENSELLLVLWVGMRPSSAPLSCPQPKA